MPHATPEQPDVVYISGIRVSAGGLAEAEAYGVDLTKRLSRISRFYIPYPQVAQVVDPVSTTSFHYLQLAQGCQ